MLNTAAPVLLGAVLVAHRLQPLPWRIWYKHGVMLSRKRSVFPSVDQTHSFVEWPEATGRGPEEYGVPMTPSTTSILTTSALARPLVPSVPSNRLAAAGFVVGTLTARALGRSWRGALEVGGAAFLAWATARELDPDHPGTANAALPVAALAALLGGAPDPLAGLGVLSSLRVLAATVGRRPSVPDLIALTGQAALVARTGERAAALVPGAALALSSSRPDTLRSAEGGAAVAATAGLLPPAREGRGRSVLTDVLVLAALGLSAALTAPETVQSRCDRSPLPVSGERVRLARGLALGTLGAGLLTRQTRSLAPLASAALLVGLRRAGPGGQNV